jgi:DNA replication licensing factor MCM3
MLEYLDR